MSEFDIREICKYEGCSGGTDCRNCYVSKMGWSMIYDLEGEDD